MTSTDQKLVTPLEVLRTDVSALEVGKEYLKAEYGRLFADVSLRGGIDERIDQLDDFEFWRMLEAMSFTYRMNGVFWLVSSEKYSWNKERWAANQVVMTGMNPAIDRITFSEAIGRNPVRFAEYLKTYFAEHQDDDPLELGQFRVDDRKIVYENLVAQEKEGALRIVDGMNRLIKMLLLEKTEFVAFVGRETNNEGRIKIGDSTFLLLKAIYERAPEGEKDAILTTVRRLIQESTDGRTAVQNYWVDHERDAQKKEVGRTLLLDSD